MAVSLMPEISVVTIVYNGIAAIEKTINAVINQSYKNVEYIIIDGGSTDGTVDVIKKYANNIQYWVSEKDKGIYDAMNKGIAAANGDWIVFINCGDFFYSNNVLKEIFVEKANEIKDADIIYGRSKMYLNDGSEMELAMRHKLDQHWKGPVFRQGAMFVKTSIMKHEAFLVEETFKVSADYEMMYRLHKKNYKTVVVDTIVLLYEKEGISDNGFKNIHDNYAIIKKYNDVTFSRWLYYQKQLIKQHLVQSFLYKYYKMLRR